MVQPDRAERDKALAGRLWWSFYESDTTFRAKTEEFYKPLGETPPRSPSEAFDVYLHQPQGSSGFMAKSSSGGIDDDGCTNTWPRRRRPPSQGWKTFPCNHADGIASMDMFVVPTTLFSTTIWIGARTWFIYSFDKKYPQRTRLHFIRRYHLRTVSVFGTADSTEFE
jgi:hypothetical protein